MKYLSLDTETGGLGTEVSLLSIGFVYADENFDEISYHEMFLRPDDGIYKVEAKALEINKINLVEHDKEASYYKDAKTYLYNYLNVLSDYGKNKLTPIGKQVSGDIRRIQQHLLSKNTWEQFCSYQVLDVSSVFKFMQNLGYFPKEMGGSLSDLLKYYGLETEGQHNALWDARMTLRVLKEMTVHSQQNYLLEGT